MNNDRFKFRVWDDKIKRYCACYSLDSDGVIWNGHTAIRLEDNKDIQVEFCTGIRDKNGKLIYDGDIVSINHSSKSQVKCIVEWGCGLTGYFCTSIKGYQDWNLASSDGPYIEIIGNIHNEVTK